jgi:hypothetical protein
MKAGCAGLFTSEIRNCICATFAGCPRNSISRMRPSSQRFWRTASVVDKVLSVIRRSVRRQADSPAAPVERGLPVVIFDCNGVLVDSESLVTEVLSDEFRRAGFPLTSEIVARFFTGRRLADVVHEVEHAAGRALPPDFPDQVGQAVLDRFETDLRATPHMEQALAGVRRVLVQSRAYPGHAGDGGPDQVFRPVSFFGFAGQPRQAGPRSLAARRQMDGC